MKQTLLTFSLVLISTFATTLAHARTTFVDGRGSGSGFCSYTQGSFCISGIKSGAERSATGQAETNCRISRGRPLSFSALCSSSCFPSILTPRDTNTLVRCNSNCRMQCEVDN
jgi:hypothetical protein